MALIFNPPTNEQAVAASLDAQVKQLAQNQLKIYTNIMNLVYANAKFEDEYAAFDPTLVLNAFDYYSQISMTSTELVELLQLTKAAINWLEIGTITDSTMEATITF